jgi:hypothetical protein
MAAATTARALHCSSAQPGRKRNDEVAMQGYEFFEDDASNGGGEYGGGIIAVRLGGESMVQEGGVLYAALCALPAAGTTEERVLSTFFNAEYLGAHCRRVSEEIARQKNPLLFAYLDRLA